MAPCLHPEDTFAILPDETSAQGDRIFTAREALSHSKPEDCWLIIHGKIYDVTSWIPHHPGGALIYVNAGRDSTQLFDSYHPLYVRKMLERYCIGVLKQGVVEQGSNLFSISYECAEREDFYLTLKKRVEDHFKASKVNPRVHPHMFVKSAVILATYLLSYYFTYYWAGSFVFSMLAAMATGFLIAEVGVSIQHDANHGAYANWKGLGYLMSASLDFVGASSFMWRQQHVVGHHSYTNINGCDPDIRVKDPDLRRVSVQQPRRNYHYFQHWYLGCLYGLLALKSVFVDDFLAYKSGCIGPVEIAKMTPLESCIFWGGKLVYILYMLVLPAFFSCHSGFRIAVLYLMSQLLAGWTLALFFQVAHVVADAAFPVLEKVDGVFKVSQGWAESQVRTTTNFCTESLFWTHVSGGLNFQIEHHLFPGVCHLHYPSMQQIVKQTCKEFNIPYKSFPTFRAALGAHFQYLKTMGRSDFKLRLDG